MTSPTSTLPQRSVSLKPVSFGLFALCFLLWPFFAHGQAATWRTASEDELKTVIPARAPVISERIETEFRTASGITDGKGHFVAGVVMITAGYSAEGKYSHFFLTQVPIVLGTLHLAAGDYVFGWTRSQDSLVVSFYQASSGKPVGQVEAARSPSITRVESFRIWPPGSSSSETKSVIQIGRFAFPYALDGK